MNESAVIVDSAPTLDIPSGSDYHSWRMKGTLPEEKPAAEPPKEETPAVTEDSAPLSETAAGSEPAPKPEQGHRKTSQDTARRIQELLTERKARDTRIAELERQIQERSQASVKPQQTPQPAKETSEPRIDDKDDKGQPKYATYEDYLSALRKYDREVSIKEWEQRQTQARQEEAEKVINAEQTKRAIAARAKYADFDQVAFSNEMTIPKGSLIDQFVIDSQHGMDVLYQLGKDSHAEFDRIAKLPPLRAHRELIKLEEQFSRPPAPKKVTNAPPPPQEVGGRGTTSPDEVEQAVKEGDQEAYRAAANARDLARRKGRR